MGNTRSAVLFSGGTDSMCAASLEAENCDEIHLLTFFESSTKEAAFPSENAQRLSQRFPDVDFTHKRFNIDDLVKQISYAKYFSHCLRFGLYNLSHPGFSSLSWHIATLSYCLSHGIEKVSDGLTRELMHFPGHMDAVNTFLKEMYSEFGVIYSNPVRDWDIPGDQTLLDRMIVDKHGYALNLEDEEGSTTTGQYIHKLGLTAVSNIKGSKFDHGSQAQCYPFVFYNFLFFWLLLNISSYERIASKMKDLLSTKADMILPRIRKIWFSEADKETKIQDLQGLNLYVQTV